MGKIIFLDVDGTLCTRDGSVPQSAIKAISKAREKGHLVYLCTGRSMPELKKILSKINVDGVIGAGGGYIQAGDKVVFHKIMANEDVKYALDYFNKYDIAYYLESNEGFFISENCVNKIREIAIHFKGDKTEKEAIHEIQWFLDILDSQITLSHKPSEINKIVFINNAVNFNEMEKVFQDRFFIYRATVQPFGTESGELAIKGCSKQNAIKLLCQTLNLSLQDTVAYGDGYNDIDMFEIVSHAVAMQNAPDDVKLKAHDTAEIAEDDGIYRSFIKNGFIE